MKNQKSYLVSLFIAICIIINYLGKIISSHFCLPVWLDSLGTVLTAYTLGPVCGAIVGVSVNIIYALINSPLHIWYCFVSIALGFTVGHCAKKGFINTIFGVLSTSFLVTIFSIVISTPINYIFFDGQISNVWGDGIVKLLQNLKINNFLSYLAGEFYIEFLDKTFTLLFLYLLIKVYRRFLKKHVNKWIKVAENNTTLLSFVFLVLAGIFHPTKLSAIKIEPSNFNNYIQTIYDETHGIPGGVTNDIEQTLDGVLWIGTYNGLYRYSGTFFRFMNEFNTVKNVNTLFVDEAGRLWIGTNDSGISICINENISNVVNQENGLPSDSIRCITQAADGNYYVGTSESLAVISLSGGLSVVRTIPEIIWASSISADNCGNIATVTDSGFIYLLKGSEILDFKNKSEKNGSSYTCCTFTTSGLLYAGTTDNNIDIFSIENGRLKYTSSIECRDLRNINSINFTEDNFYFICADNGIGFLDSQNVYRKLNTYNFNSSINRMLVDYQGNLWFTSSRQGLLRLCKSIFSEIHSNTSAQENVINTVTEWNELLFLGKDNGLEIFGEKNKELYDKLLNLFAGKRIRCLKVDSKNNLWVCTAGNGFFQISTDRTIKNYNDKNGTCGNRFRCIQELSNGVIAVAGDSGISFIKDQKVIQNIDNKSGMENPKTLCILEDKNGNILAGTDGSGIYAIKNGKVIRSYKKQDGLSSEVILRMVKDSTGNGIFIVTSNGLCYMEKDSIRLLNNFPYNNNYDLAEGRDGTIFVLSSAGIFVVDKATLLSGKKLDYELFNSKKGLRYSLTPNSRNHIDTNGNFFLSSDAGVVCFNIYNYDLSVRSYRSMLKFINCDGINYPIERGEKLKLPQGIKRIEINPEVINYSLNDPYISVWLDGFEQEPKVMLQSELSTITYTNLPVGDYVFRIAVLDNKGKKVIAESSYNIHKEKEIYDNWWFILYAVSVFTLAVVYLTWLIFRTQIQKTLNMQKRELELAKVQAQMGNEAILTVAKAVDARDENTSQHSFRVSEYSVLIAQRLGYNNNECEELKKAALLHDIGKIGIADNILKKASNLTDEEYAIMKSHVIKGAEILKEFTLLENISEGALYHHERYDGTGYIFGLKGDEIPLNARIIGLADTFDAMTANRVYRQQLNLDIVIDEIKRYSGSQFDPKLVKILLQLLDEKVIDINQIYKT